MHVDTARGAKASRPKLDLVRQLLCQGDTLMVTRLDRLSRSVLHLVTLGAEPSCASAASAGRHRAGHRPRGTPTAPRRRTPDRPPSSSRTRIARGYGPCAATDRATCAVISGTCGHGLGCIDIPHPTRDRERQDGRCSTGQRAVSPTGHGISQQDRHQPQTVVILGWLHPCE
ncbi:recombinase family protein [Streptomyces sp. NPDC091204]|uniref:recombinase family protein n=1 Tax=Streptomyces sp. NPDC091204 TaxID=3155299 RepID=UPI00343622B1